MGHARGGTPRADPLDAPSSEVALSSDVFAALRRALAAWTAPDDVLCRSPQSVVPLRAPSPDFRTVQEAVDTAIEDGAMTRIVVEAGEHDLQGALGTSGGPIRQRSVPLGGADGWILARSFDDHLFACGCHRGAADALLLEPVRRIGS